MPVETLWVEGNLDSEVFGWVLGGQGFVIRQGGSKNQLGMRVKWDREANPTRKIYFLRDRDFRVGTMEGRIDPYEDRLADGSLVGWHLCRHEMESYLMEPMLLGRTLNRDLAEIEAALMEAAAQIRHYAAARWVVGSLRPQVPFNYDLSTAPEGLGEYQLPESLDRSAQESWCRRHVAIFRDRTVAALSEDSLDEQIAKQFEFFTAKALQSVESILYWFPGKSLLTAVALKLGFVKGAGDLLPKIKSNLIKEPDILRDLSEFQTLLLRMSEV